jgi:Ala-tRNA(Pro) deacylase
MPVRKLKEFLDGEKVKYICISHSPAYTAQEVAESAHIRGHELAKVVMVKIGNEMAMAVLPSDRRIAIEDLKDVTGSDDVTFASEAEFKDRFPDCETGAMPPFGNLYGMDVYLEASLSDLDEIAFNAGSHTEVMKLSFKDFEHLVEPKMVAFTL